MPRGKKLTPLEQVAQAFHRTPEEVRQIILEEAVAYYTEKYGEPGDPPGNTTLRQCSPGPLAAG